MNTSNYTGMYFPINGASARRVSAVTAPGWVRIAVASAFDWGEG